MLPAVLHQQSLQVHGQRSPVIDLQLYLSVSSLGLWAPEWGELMMTS